MDIIKAASDATVVGMGDLRAQAYDWGLSRVLANAALSILGHFQRRDQTQIKLSAGPLHVWVERSLAFSNVVSSLFIIANCEWTLAQKAAGCLLVSTSLFVICILMRHGLLALRHISVND